jgi:hypothetical protein
MLTQKARVILVSVFAAIAYGIIHDQITAHICVEYFSAAHPPLFHTDSPTILAFCWGVSATAALGAVFGTILAEVSQSEGLPRYPLVQLCRSIIMLLAAMAFAAFLAGVLGFELSRHSIIRLPGAFAELLPPSRHDRFMAVWFAHCASYLTGLAGGALLILRIWRQRGKPRVLTVVPQSRRGVIRALILAALLAGIVYIRFAHL